MSWTILVVPEVDEWLRSLAKTDPASAVQVTAALDVLAISGPTLGRPLVDRIKGSHLTNLKELRPGIIWTVGVENLVLLRSSSAGDTSRRW